MRSLAILGSTGSIGTQALDVVRRNPDRFRVLGLGAGSSHEGHRCGLPIARRAGAAAIRMRAGHREWERTDAYIHTFRELLRAEIAETVADPADVDEEVRYLVAALATGMEAAATSA